MRLTISAFSIEKGEFGVWTKGGAGKTTVLNILGGMDTATSGKLIVDGQDNASYDSKKLTGYRRDDIGCIQFYNLVPNLTALKMLELGVADQAIRWTHRAVLEKLVWGTEE